MVTLSAPAAANVVLGPPAVVLADEDTVVLVFEDDLLPDEPHATPPRATAATATSRAGRETTDTGHLRTSSGTDGVEHDMLWRSTDCRRLATAHWCWPSRATTSKRWPRPTAVTGAPSSRWPAACSPSMPSPRRSPRRFSCGCGSSPTASTPNEDRCAHISSPR